MSDDLSKWVKNALWAVVSFFVFQGYNDQKEVKEKVNRILIEQAVLKNEIENVKKNIQRKGFDKEYTASNR